MLKESAKQCNAKAKSTGSRCKNPAILGMTKCRMHGGKSLKGEKHPNYKHGKFSDYLPERMKIIYDEIKNDPAHDLLSRNIRLRDAFLREKLAMLDLHPESAQVWQDFTQIWDDLKIAFNNENMGRVLSELRKGDTILEERLLYFRTQEEIRIDLKEQRADYKAISDIEHKGERAITATELMALMGGVLHVIKEVVTDKQERMAISDGINTIFAQRES
jgi:hypothetical protein